MILDGARGAAGYERFTSRAARCESAITELEERLKVLSQVQRKWVYLEPVYASSAAPNDSGRWSRADKEFRFALFAHNIMINRIWTDKLSTLTDTSWGR